MRLRLNERSQTELLKLMELMGFANTSPSYVIQKLISQQYTLLKTPEREVYNVNQEETNLRTL
jgi:hypothetical protein